MEPTDDLRKLRHISARIPAVLARQIEILQERHCLPHLSHALVLVVDRGLAALARERAEDEQIETTILRIEDMAVTTLAILNAVHDLDPEAVAEARRDILEEWHRRGRRGRADA